MWPATVGRASALCCSGVRPCPRTTPSGSACSAAYHDTLQAQDSLIEGRGLARVERMQQRRDRFGYAVDLVAVEGHVQHSQELGDAQGADALAATGDAPAQKPSNPQSWWDYLVGI